MKKGFLNTSSLTWSYCANWQKSDLNLQTLDASLTVFDTNTFLCTKKYWGLVPSPFYSLAKWSTWKALYMLKLYVWVVCCHGSRPVWTRETGFSSSQRQCLHPGLVYSGSYSYLVRDDCSQLQSPPQRVTHTFLRSLHLNHAGILCDPVHSAGWGTSERERFVMIAALIAGPITATATHRLSLLLWKGAGECERWSPWQQTQCYNLFFSFQPQSQQAMHALPWLSHTPEPCPRDS